jgi:hypothetical protein
LNITAKENSALFEHQFWLQILGDHARFIYNALSPKETKAVERSQFFIHTFDQLLNHSRNPLSANQVDVLTEQALHGAREIRSFKLYLLEQHLSGEIAILLPPTFINHMINEVEEYLRILECLLAGHGVAELPAIHYHLVWLPDAAGHAAAITSDLDMVEQKLQHTSRSFTKDFEDFYLKAVEMAGYLRTRLHDFPALQRFNHEVAWEMVLFKKFLRELEEMDLDLKVLGTLTPLMADHMAREECYYLIKLSQVTDVNQPDCDPTKPRTEK